MFPVVLSLIESADIVVFFINIIGNNIRRKLKERLHKAPKKKCSGKNVTNHCFKEMICRRAEPKFCFINYKSVSSCDESSNV